MGAKRFISALAVTVAFAVTAGAPARADGPAVATVGGLGAEDGDRLLRGATITREQTVERGTARYVGGVTYTLVDSTPEEMRDLFDDVAAYQRVLPRTKQARLVGKNGPDTFVELHQGNSFVEAAYTIRLRRDDGAHEVRFWLDPTKPHAIADAWGFFRYEPTTDAYGAPKILLTYGILVDLGPGLVRELFEERVRVAMLGVPQRVREYVSAQKLARR